MRRQRGLGLIELAIYAVILIAVVGALYAAWVGFKRWVAAPYVAEQKAADQKALNAMEQERDDALRDKGIAKENQNRCEKAMESQAEAQKEVDRQTARNFAAARALREQQVKRAAETAAKEGELRAQAAAKPKLLACEQERDLAKNTLRETLKARRPVPRVEK